MIKLHLGCGKRYIPGFIHVDLGDFPNIDFRRDISDLSVFSDNSVDLIYCSHSLEYFDRIQAENTLKEWFRVLKPSGTLRLAVPDFAALTEVYLKYKSLDLILGPLYGRIIIKGAKDEKVVYHKTCYDFDSLKSSLKNADTSMFAGTNGEKQSTKTMMTTHRLTFLIWIKNTEY